MLLGHLASLERLVPNSHLRMRSLQWHLKTNWSPESDPPSLPVPLSQEVREDLSWWLVRDHILQGVQFGTPPPDLHLYSDASRSGWGAHLLDRFVSGVWSMEEKLLHINLLEMKAMFLVLQSFREVVTGHRATAMCDNLTVVAYVNKQGGTVSRSLCLLTNRLLRWTESLDVHLDARYLPGQSNVLTDILSRRDQVIGTGWSLHLQVAGAHLCLVLHVAQPVHDSPQREAALVLLPRPGSPGGLRGYVSPSLGQPGCVRVSTLSSRRSGGGQGQRDSQSLHDAGRPSLAREGVVRRSPPSADPNTSHAALMGPAVAAAPLQLHPPRRPRAEPSRVATLQSLLRSRAFREDLLLRCPAASGPPLPAYTR